MDSFTAWGLLCSDGAPRFVPWGWANPPVNEQPVRTPSRYVATPKGNFIWSNHWPLIFRGNFCVTVVSNELFFMIGDLRLNYRFIHIGGIQVDRKVAGNFEWFAWNMAYDSACIPWVGSRMASVLNLAISGGYGCSCFEGVQLCPFHLAETDTAPSFLQTMDGSTVFGIHYSCVAFSEFTMFANPCFLAADWDDDLSSKTSAELKSLFMNGFGYGW